jgi:uncharacterized protein (TIGR00299 family) protein
MSRNKILYFDCACGISGDMTVGALLDLDIQKDAFLKELDKLNIAGYRIEIKKNKKNGIEGTDFHVVIEPPEEKPTHRNLEDIKALLKNSELKEPVKQMSLDIFTCLAEAEAKVHGIPVSQVHFHEIGAIDSIIDIVGTAICINMLQAIKIYASALPLGRGFVNCAHGKIPVPAPATLEILKDIPVYSSNTEGELVTPTGAAIVKTISQKIIPLPDVIIHRIGYGTGKRNYSIPSLLRVYWCEEIKADTQEEELVVMETNIDDMNPEIYSFLVPELLDKGALDVSLTSITMKKGRPGIMLSMLCNPEKQNILEELLYLETTTLGIRRYSVKRSCLKRRNVKIDTPYGHVRVKIAYYQNKPIKAAPEYEDIRKISEENSLSIQKVYGIVNKLIMEKMDQL